MLRTKQRSLYSLARQFVITVSRSYGSVKSQTPEASSHGPVEVILNNELSTNYFVRTVGSSYKKWHNILDKHPELKTLKSKDVAKTVGILNKLNYTVDDILSKPMILFNNELTIENRYSVLQECGFDAITISLLAKYIAVMNRSVATLKSYGYIPYTFNVVQRLSEAFTDVQLVIPRSMSLSEDMELKLLRQHILNCYLMQRLDMTTTDIEKLWKVYGRVRHKSFRSVQSMVQVLLNDLQFTKDRIIRNAFLLYGDVENVRRIINEIPTIDGTDVREILYRRPKILMSSCDALLATLQHVKNFGIGENAVTRCLEVLTLGPDTVLERLRDLNEIEEFQVLSTNPRVLRLVHYQNKARLRLEYLNQLKVRCASLHILSCGSETFAKFARDGSDRTKGRDIIVFLAKILEKNESSLRMLLSRHPNWCHIPALEVKNCYEFLLSKKFTKDDIYKNIHILLYPIKRIEEKLEQLQSPGFLEELKLDINLYSVSNSELLTLLLYLIEMEFHFTGDGIWTDEHTQNVENFKNFLPDFPESLNKVYKYGCRPASNNLDTSQRCVEIQR